MALSPATCTSPQFVVEGRPPVPEWRKAEYGCGGRLRISAILDDEDKGLSRVGQCVTVCGWSRSVRKQGGGSLCFVVLSDGSSNSALQVVVEKNAMELELFEKILKCGAGSSFRIRGEIVESPAAGQAVELKVGSAESGHFATVLGFTDPKEYPLAKKQHSREFLRQIGHLRPRTQFFGCVSRVRSSLAMATHRFFQDLGFTYIHTPLITTSDCEGAGEMFQVTTILPADDKIAGVPLDPKDKTRMDMTKEFFARKAFLTVSGQLSAETFAHALSDCYTFGPTFRAENSHTARHLAEFWMIEPEIAFADLEDNMRCAEAYLKFCVQWCLDHNKTDLAWFEANQEKGLCDRLANIIAEPFARCPYTEAIEILKKVPAERFEIAPFWGMDMGSEHERYLAEEHFKKPLICFDYPKEFKAFYMKINEDGKTVRAMDVLVPKIGEVIGGSQREEDLEKLDKMILEKGLDIKPYWWYRDLRKFGSVPHSGFGLGFERMIMLITGVDNIRDVIPFPRYPGCAEF